MPSQKLTNISFDVFEEGIQFLCNRGLSSDWLAVYSMAIGDTLFSNSLRTETNMVYSISIDQLLDLGKCLQVFDNNKIDYYIRQLNTKSFNRITVLSEIKVISSYKIKGYEVDPEPTNQRFEGPGLEGKSDFRVKLNDEWIYFEITVKLLHY
jgi:hypothetical protein